MSLVSPLPEILKQLLFALKISNVILFNNWVLKVNNNNNINIYAVPGIVPHALPNSFDKDHYPPLTCRACVTQCSLPLSPHRKSHLLQFFELQHGLAFLQFLDHHTSVPSPFSTLPYGHTLPPGFLFLTLLVSPPVGSLQNSQTRLASLLDHLKYIYIPLAIFWWVQSFV